MSPSATFAPSPEGTVQNRRYETLDLLRGLAAAAVVVYHLNAIGWKADPVPHGYLAVDFFFILSGFVMAHRYRHALLTTMTIKEFISLRVARLYPLALAGVASGTCVTLCLYYFRPQYTESLYFQLLSACLNIFLLPSIFVTSVSNFSIFPENGALWSLFFELAVNLAWAWTGVRQSTQTLVIVLIVSGAALTGFACSAHTTNIGWSYPTFYVGCARVCFGFTAGLLIHQAHLRLTVPRIPALRLIIVAALALVVAAPFNKGLSTIPWWDLVSVTILCPCLVMLGVGQGRSSAVGNFLGDISYALYVIHVPILTFFFFFGRAGTVKIDPIATAICAVIVSFASAWLLSEYFDRPTQKRLLGRYRRLRLELFPSEYRRREVS